MNHFWQMQLINFVQPHIPTSEPANERRNQTLALEKSLDEIVLLHEQINSLQQYLSEQLQQQQVVEQDLHYANQELELMNAEIQLMVEAKWLFFWWWYSSNDFLWRGLCPRHKKSLLEYHRFL